MKRITTMILVALLVFSSSIAVFAETSEDALTGNPPKGQATVAKIMRADALKEFTDELHQVNALRIERNQLQIQVVGKQDLLVDLYLKARENGDREVFKAAKEKRKQIKDIHAAINALHEQATSARKAFKEAVKNNDMETAAAEMNKLIGINSSINDKIKEKIAVLDSIINLLS